MDFLQLRCICGCGFGFLNVKILPFDKDGNGKKTNMVKIVKQTDALMESTEASNLAWKAGYWPQNFLYTDRRGIKWYMVRRKMIMVEMRDLEKEFGGFEYAGYQAGSKRSGLTLQVWND